MPLSLCSSVHNPSDSETRYNLSEAMPNFKMSRKKSNKIKISKTRIIKTTKIIRTTKTIKTTRTNKTKRDKTILTRVISPPINKEMILKILEEVQS